MLQFLFDTDHLTLYHHKHPPLMRRLATYATGSVAICPTGIEETLRGRLATLARPLAGTALVRAYENLVSAVLMINLFPIVAFDRACELRFQQLRSARLRIGTRDLKIGAVSLVNGLTLLTRNRKDFGRIPGLVIDDWST